MGPDMPPEPVADVIKWAQRFPCETMQITSDGPSAFTGNSVNNIGWAQTCRKRPLQMPLDGPSVFLGKLCKLHRLGPVLFPRTSVNIIGWA